MVQEERANCRKTQGEVDSFEAQLETARVPDAYQSGGNQDP